MLTLRVAISRAAVITIWGEEVHGYWTNASRGMGSAGMDFGWCAERGAEPAAHPFSEHFRIWSFTKLPLLSERMRLERRLSCVEHWSEPMLAIGNVRHSVRPWETTYAARARYDFRASWQRASVEGEDLTHAPLPRRWVDLILYLDEQERKSAEHDPSRPTN